MQWMALMVRAVEAVDFIRWTSAQRHSGADSDGPGGCTTRSRMARACHRLPARAAGVCESSIWSITWSQSCAHDLPMSWWNHLEHRLVMPKPPPAVCRARALELLWPGHAHFGHPRMMAGFNTMPMETAYRCPNTAVDPPQTGLSQGPSADGRRPSVRRDRFALTPRTTPAALPSHTSCARADCRLRLSRSCRQPPIRCLGCYLGRHLRRCLGRCRAPSLPADEVPPPQLLLPLRATLTFTLTHPSPKPHPHPHRSTSRSPSP